MMPDDGIQVEVITEQLGSSEMCGAHRQAALSGIPFRGLLSTRQLPRQRSSSINN